MKDKEILFNGVKSVEAQNGLIELSEDEIESVAGGAFMGNLPIAINFMSFKK